MNKLIVLFIDDDNEERLLYSDYLETLFGTVMTAENGKEGFAKFVTHHPDFIITDMRMPDMNGPELIQKIRKHDKHVPIVVLSAYVDDPLSTLSFSNDVDGILTKPADLKTISKLINKILLNRRAIKDPQTSLIHDEYFTQPKNALLPEISNPSEMTVVGIGASAGGLEALTSLISGLPLKNNTAYVLAQHLSPTHKTMLVDLLSRETSMRVKSAEHGEILQSDIFYITPPNKNIEIDGRNQIILSPPEQNSFMPKPSVNRLFISIAENKKDKAIGIILSGTGTDGAQGMRAINSEGGITFVQKPGSEKYGGMPMAAINGCHVDIVIEPEKMGQELIEIAKIPRAEVLKKHQLTQKNDDITTIFDLLYSYKKVDFSLYKKTTLGRRIERRMVALKVANLSNYVAKIKEDKREVEFLYKDILIGVTKFFRDAEAFASLEEKINDYLDANPDTDDFRVWVAGSSTGEEAYSIMIIIQELLNKRNQSLPFRVFATDIDEEAIQIARKGLYSKASMLDVKKEYIDRYFTVNNDEFEIHKDLREKVVFSFHNLLADPPFKQLDLVVCRNLLIYINLEAQKYVMPTFHYSLNINGLLFLGMSENATNFEHYFAPVDKLNKIFKSVAVSKRNHRALPLKSHVMSYGQSQKPFIEDNQPPIHELVITEASKLLMPKIIVANEQLEVIYKKGKFDFITVPEGYVTYNLYKIIDPRLSIDIRKLVNTANAENSVVVSEYIPLPADDDEFRFLQIHLIPVINNHSKIYIFYFNDISNLDFPHLDNKQYVPGSNSLLELELNRTKEHMQTLIEEMETTNEELQSTNEELQSSNEELQSTNEEMETSNEELQSTNEELHIAYAELKEIHKNNNQIKNDLALLNRRYESILDNISEAVVVTNKNGFILRTNDAMQKLTGCSQEKLLTERWIDHFNLEDQILANERFEKLMANGSYGRYQMRLVTKDNKFVVLDAHDYLSQDENGHTQIWTFAADITKELNALNQLAENEATYRATFEHANIGIGHLGLDGKWLKVNPSLIKTLGYSTDELLRLTLSEITYPDDRVSIDSIVQSLVTSKRASDKLEMRINQKNGAMIWIVLSITLLKDGHDKPAYLLAVIEDITPLKVASEKSAQAQAVFNNTQEAIVIVNANNTIVSVNPAFELISGYKKDDIIGQSISKLKSENHTDEFYENMFRSVTQTGSWSGEFLHATKAGDAFPTHVSINAIKDKNEKIIQYICVITDISVLVESQAKIKHLANHDVLTDLPNRNLFNERLSHAISKARRGNTIIALLFIDIDNFKVINDGLGHDVGDKVLINVTQRITNLLRENDTVARVGGDEFMVIVEDLESALDAGKIAQNIIDVIAKEMVIAKHNVTVNVSIGISLFPNDSLLTEELIHKADLAMYEAKTNGRNTFCYTDKDLSSTILERATLYNAIRNGLNNHEFEIYFQPIVNCTTLQVSYLEALIRWNHPGLGLVLPSEFIPMAEGSELIIEITKFVLYEVFTTSSEMYKLYPNFPPIAINYSLKVLKSDSIFHLFKKYMKLYNSNQEPPIIELTEREFIMSNEVNKQHLAKYKELGIKFSMDDFGTGYSNLGYLIENPFDTLKIDRLFVSKIGKDKKSDNVIKATISIAKALGLNTVGEGVETKTQFDFLVEHGCDFAQGFYLNRPVFIADIHDKLSADGGINLDLKIH